MSTYIGRRLLQALFILVGLSFLFFTIVHLTPGGPCAAYLGFAATAGDVARAKACIVRLHVNDPLLVQYGAWINGYLHGDFGTSNGGQSVSSIILAKLPATVLLVGTAFAIQQFIALPLGVFSAVRQYSVFDQIFTVTSYIGLSIPTFWLGLLLILIFAVHWPLFPVGRVEDTNLPVFWTDAWFHAVVHQPGLILGNLLSHLVLPAFTLMFVGIAADSRYMRASMLDVMYQDYIRTAKAKGVKRRSVIFKHAFRNALLPIVTNMALFLPALVGGATITESIFSWGGLGYTFYTSLQSNDYPVVETLLMMGAVSVLLANLLADLTYAWLDPRIRYD